MILYFKSIESYNLLYNARNVYLRFEIEKHVITFPNICPLLKWEDHRNWLVNTARNMTSVGSKLTILVIGFKKTKRVEPKRNSCPYK